jgi:hypothetical protein
VRGRRLLADAGAIAATHLEPEARAAAVAWLTHRTLLTCDEWPVAIRTVVDDGVEKPHLEVAPDVPSERRVRYCHTPDPRLREEIVARIAQ